MSRCPLVMIEWEDSRQPSPSWVMLASMTAPTIVRCVSVGWLVHDDKEIKALAPNMGDIEDADGIQASGIIQIPTRCVVRVTKLKEPKLSPPPEVALRG